MRVIFFLLLMLNVIYLSFAWFNQPVAKQESAPFVQRGLELRLVGESSVASNNKEDRLIRRNNYCLALGPLENADEAERSLLVNQEVGLFGRIERLSLRKNQLHWVYLPALADHGAASDMLKELHFKGVDSFIVTEGDDENAVSLGYFSNKESAIGLRTKMRNAGYEAEIRETWKDVVEFWLVFDVAPHDSKKGEDVYNSAEIEGLTVMQVACKN